MDTGSNLEVPRSNRQQQNKHNGEIRLSCTCQEKVDSKKNIYQKPRSVLN